jgi:hypothetical protein
MDNAVGAIRYAIRQFRLSPVFTASAVLMLSLGIEEPLDGAQIRARFDQAYSV